MHRPGRTLLVAWILALVAGGALPAVPTPPPPSTPQPTTPVPPRATLTVPGRPPIDGDVGTYSWDGFASDAPWLPGTEPVLVAADIVASVRFPPGTDISTWRVSYAPLVDGPIDPATAVAQSSSVTAEVDFPAPPAGTWSVRLRADFPGHGSVSYFWRFEVSA